MQDLISGVILNQKCHTHILSIRNCYQVNSTWTAEEVGRRGRIHVIITRPVAPEIANGTFSSCFYKCIVISWPKHIVLPRSIYGYAVYAWVFPTETTSMTFMNLSKLWKVLIT